MTSIPVVVGALKTVTQSPEKKTRGNQRENRDHPDHNIVNISYYFLKIPLDHKRITVIQTSGKDQPTLV